MLFICFQHVGIVANYFKNFQIMYSDLLDKLQNTLSLKEIFPTCWSTTSHWWSDEQLRKLYLFSFLYFPDILELLQSDMLELLQSDLLELLQTILKTFRLCCWRKTFQNNFQSTKLYTRVTELTDVTAVTIARNVTAVALWITKSTYL